MVDAASVSDLRRIIVSSCRDLMVAISVEPVDHASKMKLSLYLNKKPIDSVISNILRVFTTGGIPTHYTDAAGISIALHTLQRTQAQGMHKINIPTCSCWR